MMMQHQINQFLAEQREQAHDSPSHRDRDRERQRDR